MSSFCNLQVIAKFMELMYSYLNISLSKNIVPNEIRGREIHHSFPVSLFLVSATSAGIQFLTYIAYF